MNFHAIVPSHGDKTNFCSLFAGLKEGTRLEELSGSFASEGASIPHDFGEQQISVDATEAGGR